MPMELKDKDGAASDDEEDLEKLRLAALQSLKRPAPVASPFKKSPLGIKRRNFGRNRNGQFRIKNTNLISIPTIDDATIIGKDEIKLVLPQDRYCNHKKDVEEKSESTSKFDRYDNSDKSESESEYESASGSEDGSPAKLERTNSLEALMQELENEIQGNSKPKSEPAENKKKIKKRKKKNEAKSAENETVESKPIEKVEEKEKTDGVTKPIPNFNRKKSPLNPRMRRSFPKFDRKPRNIPYQIPYNTPPINYPIPMPYNGPMLYNAIPYAPIAPPQLAAHPLETHRTPYYDRPLSPLILNTDDALTIARAPLSPRSAAFVLQNRDAIERRKKSPRRSYSRSPSPRYRRSASLDRSPKFTKSRSRTPLKDERKPSPVRELRKRSPPIRRRSTENGTKKKMIRERLGAKKKRSRSPSPLPPTVKAPKVDEEKLDPVLEARKKKFETNEIKNKEGIIRLKPKADESKVENDRVDKEPEERERAPEVGDDLDENIEDILNAKVDDIFSDEETDEENEGRFKNSVANEKKRNVAVLPFAKLLDVSKGVKTDLTGNEANARRDRLRSPLRSREATNYNPDSKLDGSKKGANDSNKNEHKERSMVRRPRTERKEKLVAPIENKKIEIKIRNPSKYETTTKYDVANKNEVKERNVEKAARKVEVSAKKSDDDESDCLEGKVMLDVDEDDLLFNQKCDSGDLRAQLSRKRAERQNRQPAPENVPSRLLQSALQGAVFKKQKKTKSEDDAAPKGITEQHTLIYIPKKKEKNNRQIPNYTIINEESYRRVDILPLLQNTATDGANKKDLTLKNLQLYKR